MLKILMVIMVSLAIQMSSAKNEFYERREDSYVKELLWIEDKKDADVEEVRSVKYYGIANGEKEEIEIILEEEDMQEEFYVEEIQEIEYVEEVYVEEIHEEEIIFEEIEEYIVEEIEVSEEYTYSNGTQFEATAYAVGGWAVPSTMTAMGTEISNTIYTSSGYRIIATDPNVIPMGTVVRVTYSDGTSFLAQADDKGGMIVGNRIDILYDNVEDALIFGRQNVTVEILN